MPGADDIANQQDLLAAHRRTLALLLEQRAALGAGYAPPGVLGGIADARVAIAAAKAALRGWGVAVEDLPDDVEPPALAGAEPPPIALPPRAGGDVITANIGAGAQGVAVGKNIHQTIGAGAIADADDDRRAIEQLLAGLERELAANTAQLGPAVAAVAPIPIAACGFGL